MAGITSQESAQHKCHSYVQSPKNSLRHTNLELNTIKSAVSDALCKKLHPTAYKLQLLHHSTPDDRQTSMTWI